MTENNMWIILLMLGGGLWALGGEQLTTTIPGKKWIRRFILPVVLGAFLYWWSHQELWKVVTFAILSGGAYHLPYGDSSPWWGFQMNGRTRIPKWLTAILIIAPALFFGFSWWVPAFPFLFLGLFALSKIGGDDFSWFLVSFFYGCFIVAALYGATH